MFYYPAFAMFIVGFLNYLRPLDEDETEDDLREYSCLKFGFLLAWALFLGCFFGGGFPTYQTSSDGGGGDYPRWSSALGEWR